MSTEELFCELDKALEMAKGALRQCKYFEYENLDYLECDRTDPNEVQKYLELQNIAQNLADAIEDIEYLKKPVKGESRLYLNSRGRLEDDFTEYTCGQGIEVYIEDDEPIPHWEYSRVESEGERYYIVGYRSMNPEGFRTRIR